MIVIKLGGSLMTSGKLRLCLDKIAQDYSDTQTVIVPGGGLFADQVRSAQKQWQFSDRAAHVMAVFAMKQSALLFNALKPGFGLVDSVASLANPKDKCGVAIWSPDIAELDAADIPATWDITSDSLSAWLAVTLSAETLILVKSVKIADNFDSVKLVEQQIVDALFFEYTRQAALTLTIINAEKFLSQRR